VWIGRTVQSGVAECRARGTLCGAGPKPSYYFKINTGRGACQALPPPATPILPHLGSACQLFL
jgi:hypothetical protein